MRSCNDTEEHLPWNEQNYVLVSSFILYPIENTITFVTRRAEVMTGATALFSESVLHSFTLIVHLFIEWTLAWKNKTQLTVRPGMYL